MWSFFKTIVSWIVPVTLAKHSSVSNPVLHIKRYRGQLLLTTAHAIYSFGSAYRPFRFMFKRIQKELPKVNHFLLLGTGLGSALKILQRRYNCYPISTLVDTDEEILKLSSQYMELNTRHNVEWVCDDAIHFLEHHSQTYDLIGIDVFNDLYVPAEIQTLAFMQHCKKHLRNGGYICWNMIHHDQNIAYSFEHDLQQVFQIQKIELGKNVFYIGQKK